MKFFQNGGGVQVRHRGFRVYPFGDDDWLGLDHDRGLRKGKPKDELYAFAQSLKGIDPSRTLLTMLSMRNHVGNVEIGPLAEGFEMKANREGFLKSESVYELREFVRFCIDWASIFRDFYIRDLARQKAEVDREKLEDLIESPVRSSEVIESAVKFIDNELYRVSTHLPIQEKRKFEQTIKKATVAILSQDQSNKREMNQLRLIASTSTLLLVFSHEVKSLLGLLDSSGSFLESIEDSLSPQDAKELKNVRQDLQDSKLRFNQLMDLTSLIGFKSQKATPIKLAIHKRLKTALRCFALIVESYGIEIDYENIPRNLTVRSLLEAELYIIMMNIISNSIKSVIASGKDKRIKITAHKKDNRAILTFRDTGIGLNKKYFEDAFAPFVADPGGDLYKKLDVNLNPEDKYIVGAGTGLGLGIVKEIVENKNGTIRFCEPEGKWRAILEVCIT